MDIARYEAVLRQRQSELLSRLNRIETDLEQPRSADNEDRATESANDEVLEELGQVGQDELKAIDAALERIVVGTFGHCVRCGNPIAEERLSVIPYAPLCENCIRN